MKSLKTLLAVTVFLNANYALALGGLADLSVYDRTEGRQLAVHWHEGRAYVAGEPGNKYQVTLRSRSREEVLAVVSVDGINMIKSLAHLLARGVIRQPVPVAPLPRPFPDFVPDPRG